MTVSTDDLTLLGGGAATLRGLVLDGVSGVWVEGFEVDAEGTGQPAVLLDGQSSTVAGCTLLANELHSSDSGVPALRLLGASTALLVHGNAIHDSGADGIDLDSGGSSVGLLLEQNIVRHNDLDGLYWGSLHKGELLGNTFSDNQLYGVEFAGSSPPADPDDFLVRFNRIVGNAGPPSAGQSSADIGRYDEIFGTGDSGNQTTSGAEGGAVDRGYPPAAGGAIPVVRPVRWNDPSLGVHPYAEWRWAHDSAAMTAHLDFPLMRWEPYLGSGHACSA